MEPVYVCRGLRKWCDRRCEARTSAMPAGYPTMGFYCPLHTYQAPKMSMAGTMSFESPAVGAHVRRTSFKAPEAIVAEELCKRVAIGSRGGSGGGVSSVTGTGLVAFLKERKSLDDAGCAAYAARMVDLGILVPMDGSGTFRPDTSTYRIVPSASGGSASGGASGGAGTR